MRGDEIEAFLAVGPALILALQIFAAGGGTRIETSTLSRDRIEHSGGVVAAATLADASGAVFHNEVHVRHARALENGDELEAWRNQGL